MQAIQIRRWIQWRSSSRAGLILVLALGGTPVFGQPRDYAYVTMSDANAVSVVDTVSQTVVATIPVGSYPFAVAFTPDRTRAYVANELQDAVSVIDTMSDTVVATVAVGGRPAGLAITPEGTFAYVPTVVPGPQEDPDMVAVIDTNPSSPTYQSVVAMVPVGRSPTAVAITPDGDFAFVANGESRTLSEIDTRTMPPLVVATVAWPDIPATVTIAPDGTFAYVGASIFGDVVNIIWVMETGSLAIVATIDLGDRQLPQGIAFTPDGSRAYVAVFHDDLGGGGGFKVIDTATHTVVHTQGFESEDAVGVALNPDGSRAYVTGRAVLGGPDNNAVWVIDTATQDVVGRVQVGENPTGIALGELQRPSRPRIAYVTSANSVSVIDTDTQAVFATVPVGTNPSGVAITPDDRFAYVVNRGSHNLSVIDTATHAVVDTISLAPSFSPSEIAFTPNGAFAYVTNSSVSVSVIDTATRTVVDTIDMRSLGYFGPFGVAVTPDGTRAYVTNILSTNVAMIDTATHTVVATIPDVGSNVWEVAVTPNGAFAYVTSNNSPFVAVIDTDPYSPTYNTVVERINVGVGGGCAGITLSRDGAFAYVVDFLTNTVLVIATASNYVVDRVSAGPGSLEVAVTRSGAFAYVTNNSSSTVSVIDTAAHIVVATVPVPGSPWGVAAR